MKFDGKTRDRPRFGKQNKRNIPKNSIQGKDQKDKTDKRYTSKGVRQGCPLSTAMFNLAMADLEKTMQTVQEGGIVIGKKKAWTVSYADDVVLMANNEAGMKGMLRKFHKFIEQRGLELNTEK